MLSRKKRTKTKFSPVMQESNLDFLITTFIISLLTILGFFISYKNKDKLVYEIKDYNTKVISANLTTDKAINEVSNKMITVPSGENIEPATVNTKSFILMQGLNFIPGTVTPTKFSDRCFYIEILQTTDFGFHDLEIGKPATIFFQ